MATTTYSEHGWFLDEVARLQSLTKYATVNEATAALTVGEDAFERWDAPVGITTGWRLGSPSFRQVVGAPDSADHQSAWVNAEGAAGLVAWFPSSDEVDTGEALRREDWLRIH